MKEIEFEVKSYKNVSGGITFQIVGVTGHGLEKLNFVHQAGFETNREFDKRMFHYFEAPHGRQNSFHCFLGIKINCTKKFKFASGGNGCMYLREVDMETEWKDAKEGITKRITFTNTSVYGERLKEKQLIITFEKDNVKLASQMSMAEFNLWVDTSSDFCFKHGVGS